MIYFAHNGHQHESSILLPVLLVGGALLASIGAAVYLLAKKSSKPAEKAPKK